MREFERDADRRRTDRQRLDRIRRPLPTRFAALLLWALALVATLPASVVAAQEIGVIKSVTGQASLARNGGATPVAVGQSLELGDRIETDSDGAVGFTLNDGSRFSVGPNSAIIVEQFEFQPAKGLLALIAELIYGTMTHSSGDIGRMKPEAVKIGTPLGVVGVRGTRFAIKQPQAAGNVR